MQRQLLVRAPAKLNLALSVGPVIPNGMHPICSWMATVNLEDELNILKLDQGSIARFATIWHEDAPRKSDIEWPFATDLVAKAHALLEKTVAQPLPVQSTLRKRIPIGGGLGGGSADAAAMLLGLNRLFELGIGTAKLAELGSQLGSDVPFFIYGGNAVVEGLGEQVEQLSNTSPIVAVLAFPEASCPTGRVYTQFDEMPKGNPALQSERVREMATSSDPNGMFNDLAEAAFDLFPEVREAANAITEIAEQPVHLSGSGSTLFSLCPNSLHAEHLAATITERLELPAIAVSSCTGVALSTPKPENAQPDLSSGSTD